ncbi:MAG: OsmC family peroxiredoxin [Chloroflexi bacterium]|nr:OsmC family peroxiredoxin [Chloroflexota bacterium]
MTTRPKSFIYNTSLRWQRDVEGVLSAPGKPDIKVSSPPEFKGPEGNWTPENLYIAAIETCLMLTYLAYCRSRKVELASYTSAAEGVLEPISGVQIISKVTVRPKIVVKGQEHLAQAQEIASFVQEKCFISNSVESDVIVEPEISVAG